MFFRLMGIGNGLDLPGDLIRVGSRGQKDIALIFGFVCPLVIIRLDERMNGMYVHQVAVTGKVFKYAGYGNQFVTVFYFFT